MNSARHAANVIHEKYRGNPRGVWFEGHWGFQYYMMENGGVPWDYNRRGGRLGDRIIFPENNYYVGFEIPWRTRIVERRTWPAARWVTTMHPYVGAGFYAQFSGPLPFAFAAVPDEGFVVSEFVSREP